MGGGRTRQRFRGVQDIQVQNSGVQDIQVNWLKGLKIRAARGDSLTNQKKKIGKQKHTRACLRWWSPSAHGSGVGG
jgi:hypothetical protein